MALSKEQIDLFENNTKQQLIIQTLEISHSVFDKKYYISRDVQDRYLNLETNEKVLFLAKNFSVQTPSFSQKLDSTLQFSIDIVNFELIQQIEKLMENPSREFINVIYRVFTDQNSRFPILGPLKFEVDSFSIEKNRLVVSAKIHELINNKFPKEKFTKQIFRGLKYV